MRQNCDAFRLHSTNMAAELVRAARAGDADAVLELLEGGFFSKGVDPNELAEVRATWNAPRGRIACARARV